MIKTTFQGMCITLLVCLFSFGNLQAQPCPTGQNFTFNTQAQIDAFGIDYAHCTDIVLGNVIISGADITNLQGLSNLSIIDGNLFINLNESITELNGLNNLTNITNSFQISGNTLLSNITGFNNLINIGGNITISNNNLLTQLNNFDSLNEVDGFISISHNNLLTEILGFNELENVMGLSIFSNGMLNNLNGFSNLTTIGASLTIYFNNQLNSIQGLNNLSFVGGNFLISDNSQLNNIQGLNSLTNIGGGLQIAYNDQLTSLDGLSSLADIGGDFILESNNQLTSLNGLSSLTGIGGSLGIAANNQLTHLDGLSSVTSIGGLLGIGYNNLLTDISGIQNIDPASIDELYIIENPNLSVCNLPNICEYLSYDPATHPRFIWDNLGDCLDEAAIFAACTVVSDPGWQITALNTSFIIDFDNTIAEVNEGPFAGGGFSPSPGAGQLNSSAFITGGWSDAPNSIDFGDTSPTSGDFARGTNAGTTGTGGIWGFEVGPGNRAFGIKPSGSDFTPGYITLRLQNQTGQPVGSLELDYNVLVYNNGNRSNSFNLSFSLDNITFEPVSALDFVSPEVADATPSWQSTLKNTLITNIILNPGDFLYLRWDGNDVSGSGSRDAFALDDIQITAFAFCEQPLALTAGSITDTTASLSWSPGGAETQWELVYGAPGFDPDTQGTTEVVNNDPEITIAGLNPDTAYEVYVRANCDLNFNSIWSEPLSFSTLISCPTGQDFTFSTQAQIDAFGVDYAGCTDIALGNVTISGEYITNLQGLSNVTSIEGNLIIFLNFQLTSLQGLNSLETIGGFLEIFNNALLTNLEALNNLTSIGGDISIVGNSELNSLQGLNGLTTVGSVEISTNFILSDLEGLSNVTSIGGNLTIFVNGQLTSLQGLNSLETIGGFLEISNNALINNLDALNNLTSIGGNLYLDYNIQLTDLLGLSNVTDIGGDILIFSHGQLQNLQGLNNVTSIGGDISIVGNSELNSLQGLNGLTTVGSVEIRNNNTLPDLVGLNNITNIDGQVVISFNDQLATLQGLNSLTNVSSNLIVAVNEQLTSLQGLNSLVTIGGSFNIVNNPLLNNIEDLNNLTTIDGNFTLSLSQLTNLQGLNNLSTIGGNFYFEAHNQLTNFDGLNSLTNIGGDLQMAYNNQLSSLNGFSSLTGIGGFLIIYENNQLTHLDGLSSVTSIGGLLGIGLNNQLTDISGIQNIDPASINVLYIIENPNLSVCNLPNICEYLSNDPVTHPRFIWDNLAECFDETAVINACAVCTAPDALTAVNIDTQSADLSWQAGDAQTQWEAVYAAPGFDPDTQGTIVVVNNDPELTIAGLNPGTAYEVYVRAVCDVNNKSTWTGPLNFTTLDDCSASNPLTVQIDSTVAPDNNNNVVVFSGAAPFLGLPSSTTLSAVVTPSNYTDLTYEWFWRELPSGSFQANPLSSDEILVVNASGEFAREYKLVVSNSSGCIAENTISIISVEASCGNNSNKVLVCFVTPNGNSTTICVSANAVNALLAANPGSYIGSCYSYNQTASQTAQGGFLEIESWPNPSNNMFSIKVNSTNTEEPVQFTVFDIAGRFIEESTASAGEIFKIGGSYSTGIYIVKVSQGEISRYIKLVKK